MTDEHRRPDARGNAGERHERAMTPSGPAGLRPPAAADELDRDDGAPAEAEADRVEATLPGRPTAAGGGYGTGSGEGGGAWLGTGGASEPDAPGDAPSDWLRSEETGAPSDAGD